MDVDKEGDALGDVLGTFSTDLRSLHGWPHPTQGCGSNPPG